MDRQTNKGRKRPPSKFSNLQFLIFALIMAAAVMLGSHGYEDLVKADAAATAHKSK